MRGTVVQLKLCATSPPPFQGQHLHLQDICMPLSSLLRTIKVNGGIECTWCLKNSHLSTSICCITAGSTCRQHSHGMSPIVSTPDAWYTNATLPRISSHAFVTGVIAKMLKSVTQFLLIMDSPEGLLPRDFHFWIALVKLMLRSDWHVTPQHTVLEIFAVKCLFRCPKQTPFSFFGLAVGDP